MPNNALSWAFARKWLLKAQPAEVDTKGVRIDVSAARERFLQTLPSVRLAWGTALLVVAEAVVGPRNHSFFAQCFFYLAAGIALLGLYGLRAISNEQSTQFTKLPGLLMASSVVTLMVVSMLFHGEWYLLLLAVAVVVSSIVVSSDHFTTETLDAAPTNAKHMRTEVAHSIAS